MPEAPFVSQTPISSSAMNSDLSDVASAITGSLARDGQGGMTAILPLANAGVAYVSDPDTGLHRTGANEQALFCGGTDRVKATATGGEVNGDLNVTGALTVGGAALIPVGLGSLWFGLTAPSKWIIANGQSLLRASYPALWTFAQTEIAGGNTLFTNGNGSTTFTVADMTGRIGAGREAVATRLTSTYFGGNSTILGATGGLESNTLTTAQLASHTHTNSLTDPGHFHQARVGSSGGGTDQVTQGVNSPGANVGTGAGPILTNTTGISITNASAGSGAAHNNTQPTIIVNYIIYAGA